MCPALISVHAYLFAPACQRDNQTCLERNNSAVPSLNSLSFIFLNIDELKSVDNGCNYSRSSSGTYWDS